MIVLILWKSNSKKIWPPRSSNYKHSNNNCFVSILDLFLCPRSLFHSVIFCLKDKTHADCNIWLLNIWSCWLWLQVWIQRFLLKDSLGCWLYYIAFFFPLVFFFFLIFLTVPGLSSGMWDLVPRPGIELRPPALGVWSLSHRTTNRELPDCIVCQAFLISFGVWCAQLLSSFWLPATSAMDCSLPESSGCGISQARILEWVAISPSRGTSLPSDWTCVSYISCIGRQVFYHYLKCGGLPVYLFVWPLEAPPKRWKGICLSGKARKRSAVGPQGLLSGFLFFPWLILPSWARHFSLAPPPFPLLFHPAGAVADPFLGSWLDLWAWRLLCRPPHVGP